MSELFWIADDMKVEDASFEVCTDSWTDKRFLQVSELFWISNDMKVEDANFEVCTDSWPTGNLHVCELLLDVK